jgi:hypothetical protein
LQNHCAGLVLAVFAVKVASFYFILNLNIIMKGIESKTIFLIIAVIIAVLSLIILFPAASQLILKGWGLEQILGTQLTAEEKAILCAYYRCIEGCVSDNTRKYCENLYEGSWADVCSKPEIYGFTDDDQLRVCKYASQFPVEIHTSIKKEISLDSLGEAGKDACGVNEDSSPDPQISLGGEAKYVFFSKTISTPLDEVKCIPAVGGNWVYRQPGYVFSGVNKAFTKVKISGENFFIYTTHNQPPSVQIAGGGSYTTTEVQAEPKYIILLEKEKSYKVALNDNFWYRISIRAINPYLEYGLRVSILNPGEKRLTIYFKNITFSGEYTLSPSYRDYYLATIGGYLNITLIDVTPTGTQGILELTYTSHTRAIALKRCEDACKEQAGIGKTLTWYGCRDECTAPSENAPDGNEWCKRNENKNKCC